MQRGSEEMKSTVEEGTFVGFTRSHSKSFLLSQIILRQSEEITRLNRLLAKHGHASNESTFVDVSYFESLAEIERYRDQLETVRRSLCVGGQPCGSVQSGVQPHF